MWLEMPYIFRDIDHKVMAFNESEIGKQLVEASRQESWACELLRRVDLWDKTHYIESSPLEHRMTLKDFRLRVPEQHVCIEYAEALGAEPTPIAYAEAGYGFAAGVVDGLENPLSAIFYAMRFMRCKEIHQLDAARNQRLLLLDER